MVFVFPGSFQLQGKKDSNLRSEMTVRMAMKMYTESTWAKAHENSFNILGLWGNKFSNHTEVQMNTYMN